jgi:5-hydroxyisourate hydrolase-like protein (transthyretin family)
MFLAFRTSVVVVFVATLNLPAQKPQPDQVSGRIISALDGHPLAHATVTLTEIRQNSNEPAATTTSDSEGQYNFGHVATGKYRLTGRARGFIQSAYLAHGQYGSAIVTGAGLDTTSLVLSLTPTASITGRVLDEAGEPVEHANVTLFRQDLTEATHITRFRNAMVDDDGSYELSNLPPGTYFLSASGQPWYAVHPRLDQPGLMWPYRSAVDPALDVAYPELFYPGALDSSAAQPIKITGGEQITADMQLQPQHAVTLTLRTQPGERPNGPTPQLVRSVFGNDEPIQQMQMENTEGEQRISGIAPGQYHLQQFAPGGGYPVQSPPIDLTNSLSMDALAPASLSTVTITLHSAPGTSLPETLQVSLRRVGSQPFSTNHASKNNIAEVTNVVPGDYRIVIFGSSRALNVLSLSSNGQPSPDKRVHVTGGGTLVFDVTVSSASVTIEGFTRRDGKPDVGSMVVLVPAGADTNEDLFRRDQSDLDGSFTFYNVPPGNYIAVAIDDGWPLRWSDVATITPYLLHGTPVSVTPTSSGTVHLAAPITPQPR